MFIIVIDPISPFNTGIKRIRNTDNLEFWQETLRFPKYGISDRMSGQAVAYFEDSRDAQDAFAKIMFSEWMGRKFCVVWETVCVSQEERTKRQKRNQIRLPWYARVYRRLAGNSIS